MRSALCALHEVQRHACRGQVSALEKLGKKDQAIAVYREIIEQDPENNYADLAKERLEELGN